MEFGLKGKTAFVMAGSKGLGKAAALKLSEEGANIAIISRSMENLKKAQKDIKEKTGKSPFIIQGDVKNKKDVENAVKETVKKFSTVHILFANAGGPPAGGFFDFKPEDYEEAVKLNLMSTIYATYAVIPFMKENKWGRIIASVSISVKQPMDSLILSNVSRAGVITFIKSVSNAVAPFNITANSILTGYTMTDRVKNLLENAARKNGTSIEEASRNIIEKIPMGRIGTVEEYASLVAFLASEKASYITGISIPIDGGYIKCI
jgi:3-oxoacyl-[acyl-carrier protein] reductase